MRKISEKIFLLLIFTCCISSVYAQDTKLDSLKRALVKYEADKKKAGIKGLHQMDTAKVHIYDAMAYAAQQNSSEEALGFIKAELKLSEQLKFKDGIADAYNVWGIYYGSRGNLDKALQYFEKNLALRLQLKDPAALSFAYMNIGSVHNMKGNSTAALHYILQATKMAAKAKNKFGVASGYNNMAIIYDDNGKSDEAIASYRKALQLFEELNDDYNACIAQFNIGNLYVDKKEFEKSMYYFDAALKIAKKSGNKDIEADIYSGMASIYRKQKKYDEALKAYEIAYAIKKETNDVEGLSASEIGLGRLYADMGNLPKSISYFEPALKKAQQNKILGNVKRAAEGLAQTYAGTGNYKRAYENMVLFKKMEDTLYNMEKDKKLTELRLTYEFGKKQDAQKLLQQKKDTATALEADRQRNIIYFSLLALLAVTALAFWINVNLQRNKKQKKIIEEQKSVVEQQNEKIQESLEEKETLLREIHHRVKNNLQIISSLLNIQSENIQDESLLSSIQEGQSRVQAMSLIHQNLYQSEQVNNVDIENYLRELVVYLSQMFRADSKSIQTEINTEGIQFDIDTAIPLGLIVNELVSNAYKYAFENRESGKIKINIRNTGNDYELHIDNDGKPLPDDFDIKNTKSLGLKLVSILSRQLRGKFSFHSDENNTSFVVIFKDLKAIGR